MSDYLLLGVVPILVGWLLTEVSMSPAAVERTRLLTGYLVLYVVVPVAFWAFVIWLVLRLAGWSP